MLLVYQTDGPNLEHEIENSPFDSWGVTNSSAKRGKIYVSFLNRERVWVKSKLQPRNATKNVGAELTANNRYKGDVLFWDTWAINVFMWMCIWQFNCSHQECKKICWSLSQLLTYGPSESTLSFAPLSKLGMDLDWPVNPIHCWVGLFDWPVSPIHC